MTLVLTLVAAAVVGATLGLLGGGGSILTVPLLIYLAGVPAKPAMAASLFVVGVTSLVGLVAHARAGRVRWRTGVLFGVAGMVGAYAGGRVAEYLPATLLLVGFGLMMAATAVAMLRPRPTAALSPESQPVRDQNLVLILVEGAVVGLVTGLVGAGGGFVVVPALVVLGGLPMAAAVGTSLLVLTMQTTAGFIGHLHGIVLDWPLILAVTGLAVAGVLVGGRFTGRVNARVLRRVFGWFVVAMAVFVLAEQAPAAVRNAVSRPLVGVPLLAGIVVLAGAVVLWRGRRMVGPAARTPDGDRVSAAAATRRRPATPSPGPRAG